MTKLGVPEYVCQHKIEVHTNTLNSPHSVGGNIVAKDPGSSPKSSPKLPANTLSIGSRTKVT